MITTYQGYQAERGQAPQDLLRTALTAYQARCGRAATVVLANADDVPDLVPPPGVTVHPAPQVRPRTLHLGHEEPAL